MIQNYPDLTHLWHDAARYQLTAKRKHLDFVANIDTMLYDNVLSCDSMAYDFDAGRDLWLTKSRFTVLQRDYLDLGNLMSFLDRCESIGLGEAKRGVVTQMFAKQHSMRAKKYRWGNCMMAWCFRGGNKGETPTLALYSRVSYIAYIGGLDLALCAVLAREIGQRIGCEPSDIRFRWHCDSLQFHGFKSLPFLFRADVIEGILENPEDYPSKRHPTIALVRKWYEQVKMKYEVDIPLEDEKYGPLRRIRRRYQEYRTGNFLPPLPLESMTFNPLKQRG